MVKVDLLVKENFIKHINNKLSKYDSLLTLCSDSNNYLLLESILPIVISYFDAAIMDTIKEYVYARPYEIFEKELDNINSNNLNKDIIKDIGFNNYLIENYISKIKYQSYKEKIVTLRNLCNINIELGNEKWEYINETIARRNCMVHNDLIANNTYFKKSGNKADDVINGSKLEITYTYLSERIGNIKEFLLDIRNEIEFNYSQNTNVNAVKGLWNYLFENRHPLEFSNCWDDTGGLITYIGPNVKELKNAISPRTISLFTAWMSFFNGSSDVKYFSSIFYNSKQGREVYSEKFKYLIDCFERVDFQWFNIEVYDKDY